MSFKRSPDEFDSDEEEDFEEEEEEGEEFFPGVGDDDEDLDDDLENEEISDNEDEIPTFLQGDFSFDKTDSETIVYKKNGSFCLKSQDKPPSTWSLRNPLLEKSLSFGGWIANPAEWIDFRIQISLLHSIDPLDEKMLKAQQESLQFSEKNEGGTRLAARSKSDDQLEDVNTPSPCSTTPLKGNLKAPPSYALKDSPPSVQRQKSATKPGSKSSTNAYAITGWQIGQGERINFRGVFYAADDGQRNIFLICSVRVDEHGGETTTITTPSAAAAPAAASRKRGRLNEDDAVGSNGIDYQELIDLHNEATLSAEELTKRYSHANAVEVGSFKSATRSKKTSGDDGNFGK